MLEIYLGRNTKRNQNLLAFLEEHKVAYSCIEASQMNREHLLHLFSHTSDCFDLLSPSFLRFKREESMSLNELIHLVLQKPEQSLRFPVIVYKERVYPDMSLEEARTFYPET